MTTILAPAKLTLSLRVTGRRPDGYHLIDAEMVAVDLCDALEIAAADRTRVEMLDAAGSAVHGDCSLVGSALALVGRSAEVRLTKRIPMGAGLGGGSADAAAVLRWAGHEDPRSAASIGADVAFCLRGGRARVTGIGEKIEPLAYRDEAYTLLTPPFGCSTRAVYEAWDALGGPPGDNGNDLAPAALAVAPELAEWRDRLAGACDATPRLAGSGSTWFVPGAFPGPGRLVVRTVPAASPARMGLPGPRRAVADPDLPS